MSERFGFGSEAEEKKDVVKLLCFVDFLPGLNGVNVAFPEREYRSTTVSVLRELEYETYGYLLTPYR